MAAAANDSTPVFPPASILLDIENLRNQNGAIRCALFDSEKGFPGDMKRAVAGQTKNSAENRCEFPGVPPGSYAVAVFHDENANGKFDTKFYGMPKEGYGASNNPKPRVGPPRYADSRFEHGSSDTQLRVKLIYW